MTFSISSKFSWCPNQRLFLCFPIIVWVLWFHQICVRDGAESKPYLRLPTAKKLISLPMQINSQCAQPLGIFMAVPLQTVPPVRDGQTFKPESSPQPQRDYDCPEALPIEFLRRHGSHLDFAFGQDLN